MGWWGNYFYAFHEGFLESWGWNWGQRDAWLMFPGLTPKGKGEDGGEAKGMSGYCVPVYTREEGVMERGGGGSPFFLV